MDSWQTNARSQALAALQQSEQPIDLLIVGGGITGAGILLEASKRGLRALLVEQRDFAWGTSSRSSKMVHGGLRYLASGDLALTRDAVRERKRLLNEALGLVEDLHFVMPQYQGGFPGPKVFDAVLCVYDWMAGKQNHEFYPASQVNQWVSGLKPEGLLGAMRFADAVVDDARLVLRVLEEARSLGAQALNYLRCETLQKTANGIAVQLRDEDSGERFSLSATAVVNATGAWTDELRAQLGKQAMIRPLRGSHLVLPFWRLPVACALSFAHPKDQRPVFVFPWQGVTMIGTTDLDHRASLQQEAQISAAEIDYLLSGVNSLLPTAKLSTEDIQASIAGVRPVVAGSQRAPSKEKREHAIWDDGGIVSVAGGKLTTFRLIALDVLKALTRYLPDAATEARSRIFTDPPQVALSPLSHSQRRRLQGHYGRHAQAVAALSLEPVANSDTLWGELSWALEHEAVQHLDDLLLRRTRLGLLLPQGAVQLKAELALLCQRIKGWDSARFAQEWARYDALWQRAYAPQPAPMDA